MLSYRRSKVGRAIAALGVALTLAVATPAQAQGLLDALFGGLSRRPAAPPRMNAYADPGLFGFGHYRERRVYTDQHGGVSSGYCVRTCDGRYFTVKSSGNMSAAELCKSFCPAAKTKIFSGSRIDYAMAGDGQRYADLDTAFLYRERRVDNCTCNGRDAYGLATLDVADDPTLRPGDIVATNGGLATYIGNRSAGAEFTPIDQSGGSSEWRRRLMATKVTPAPPQAQITPVPDDDKVGRADRRRVQR